VKCHCCQSQEVKKFGSFSNRNRTVQRFQCLTCGKTFSESQPLEGVRIESEKAAQVVAMLCEGVGIRAIGRLTGLNKNTVLNVLETAGQHCEELLNQRLVNLQVNDVQIDEVYSFVHCLEANTHRNDPYHGEQYVFLAFERTSKLILNWEVGKRDGDTTQAFLQSLKRRVAGRFQLTSDGFHLYHDTRSVGVRGTFGNEIDYGIEIKHYAQTPNYGPYLTRRQNPVKLQWIKRIPKIGNPDCARMTVNHLERQNLNIRLFNRRFTRKTLGYSKIMRNHRLALALQIAHFNFCRVHSAHSQTPAQAAKLADHPWTVAELLTATIQ